MILANWFMSDNARNIIFIQPPTCTKIQTYSWLYKRTRARVCVCMYVHVCVYVYMWVWVFCECVCAYMQALMCVCVHAGVCIMHLHIICLCEHAHACVREILYDKTYWSAIEEHSSLCTRYSYFTSVSFFEKNDWTNVVWRWRNRDMITLPCQNESGTRSRGTLSDWQTLIDLTNRIQLNQFVAKNTNTYVFICTWR